MFSVNFLGVAMDPRDYTPVLLYVGFSSDREADSWAYNTPPRWEFQWRARLINVVDWASPKFIYEDARHVQ